MSYGSVDGVHGKASQQVEKDSIFPKRLDSMESGISSASTAVPPEETMSFMSIIHSLADGLSGEGVVHDQDAWDDYDDENETGMSAKGSLKQSQARASLKPKPTSSKKSAVINLMNNVVGAGILTMPAAVQAASLVTSLTLMVVIGFISAISFMLIGYLCSKLQCSTYRQLWSKAFGSRSGFLVDLSLLLNSVFGCLSFMILMCDLIEKSYPGLFHTTHAPPRAVIIGVSTVVIILPLCHLKNLATLKYTSILAIIAFVYVWGLVQFEFWSMSPGTTRLADGKFKLDSGMLFAVSIFNSGYKAHYNAPSYFTELGSDLNSHMLVSAISFGIVMILYIVFSIAAFGLFGNDTEGNVLKNFPQGNTSVLWAWLAMALVTMFSYPLVFKTGRDSLFTLIPLLSRAEESSPLVAHSAVVTSLVVVISVAACILPDVSLVVGMSGATVGAALCWTIPAAIYIKSVTRGCQKCEPLSSSFSALSSAIVLFVVSLACIVGCSVVVLKR